MKEAEWEKRDNKTIDGCELWYCTNCGSDGDTGYTDSYTPYDAKMYYCPRCGAKMQFQNSKKYLWRFQWDTGIDGRVDGLFTATEQEVFDIIGTDIYFGEILGKYSEVHGIIDQEDIQKIDIDPDTVAKVSAVLGNTWCGYNPFEFIDNEQ